MDYQKGELAGKDESAAKNRKVVTWKFKFKSNINRVTEEIAGHGMLTVIPIGYNLQMQPEELSEGKFCI